ncbi:enoyl-CoA hydratase/isomerase family protein [Turneriella parva]|nr:enoyl-CoA hydratase/isomerase family protein [Turneriella parva]
MLPGIFKFLRLEKKDHIGYIYLAKSENNELDADFLNEIILAHDLFEADDDVWGVIWTSDSPSCFCSGFDPRYMHSLDKAGKMMTFHKLFKTTHRVFAFSKPELVLLTGYALAAGSVIMMGADWRFLNEDKARISFPEVMLGISIPSAMIAMLRLHAGEQNLSRLVQMGDSIKPQEALKLGIVNEIMPLADLMPAGERFMKRLFQKPLGGFRAVKKNLRRDVLALFENDPSLGDFEELMGANFDEALLSIIEKRRPKFNNP